MRRRRGKHAMRSKPWRRSSAMRPSRASSACVVLVDECVSGGCSSAPLVWRRGRGTPLAIGDDDVIAPVEHRLEWCLVVDLWACGDHDGAADVRAPSSTRLPFGMRRVEALLDVLALQFSSEISRFWCRACSSGVIGRRSWRQCALFAGSCRRRRVDLEDTWCCAGEYQDRQHYKTLESYAERSVRDAQRVAV